MELQEALKFYPSFTQEDIAVLTGLPIHAVRRALKDSDRELTQRLTQPWRTEILATTEGLALPQAAKMHSTLASVIHYARYHGVHKTVERGTVDHAEVKAFIIANHKKMTQIEMAEALGVSQALISQLNPYRQPIGKVLRKTPGEWVVILEYAKKHNILQAAKRYNVSRTAIHKRMKQNAQG
jgi:predicted DNA-binding protein (UPF0251 family)